MGKKPKDSGLKASSSTFTPSAKQQPAALLTEALPLPNPWIYLPYLPLDAFHTRGPDVCSTFEHLEVLRLISGDLSTALALSDVAFAGTVLHNKSFVTLLDTFVRYAPRTHDAATRADEEAKVIDEASHDAEAAVSTRVLRCIHRIVLGGADTIAQSLRVQLVDAALSVPALVDICSIFAEQNSKLVSDLVKGALEVSCNLREQLEPFAEHCYTLLSKMCEQAATAVSDPSASHELLGYLTDIAVSLAMLFKADPATITPFTQMSTRQQAMGDESWHLLTVLAMLHHQIAPSLARTICGPPICLDVAQMALMDVAQAVVHSCMSEYLPNSKGASLKRAPSSGDNEELLYGLVPLMALQIGLCPDSLLSILPEGLTEGNSLLASLCAHWEMEDQLREISSSAALDQARLEYSIGLISEILDTKLQIPMRVFPPAPDGAPSSTLPAGANKPSKAQNLEEQLAREQAHAQSEKEQFVLDMMPDTDIALVKAGLEYYRGEVDQFIQALMDGNLPPALSAAAGLSAPAPADAEEPQKAARRGLVSTYDGDLFDTASSLPSSVVWRGKSSTDQFRRGDVASDVNVEAILNTQWEEQDIEVANSRVAYDPEYDDEYDDAYDDVPSFGLVEAGTADIGKKVLFQRNRRLPGADAEEAEESEESEDDDDAPGGQGWQGQARGKGGKGKGADQGRGNGGGGKGKGGGGGKGNGGGWKGAGRGQTIANKKKEQNKAHFGNHNRRRGADKKAKAMVG